MVRSARIFDHREGLRPNALYQIRTPAQENMIDETLAIWQPRSKRQLSREDAREILENVVGLFSLLDEWRREEERRAQMKPVNSE